MKSEPTHEDHMKVVNKENRFAKKDRQRKGSQQEKAELMAFQGRQAVLDATNTKDWKNEGMAS